MLDLFLSKGFNEIDTAYMYCDGKTEELLGKVPAVAENKFVIATKVNAFGPGGEPASAPLSVSLFCLFFCVVALCAGGALANADQATCGPSASWNSSPPR